MGKERKHRPLAVPPSSQPQGLAPVSRFAPAQARRKAPLPSAQEGIANGALAGDERETSGLQRKPGGGMGTPAGPPPLAALHAKVEGAWAERLEKAARLGHNIARVAIRTPGQEGSAPVQARRSSRQPARGVE